MRPKEELESRIALVRDSRDVALKMAFREAVKATKGKSPSASFDLAYQIASQTEEGERALATARAVRWQRVLERDYPE